MLNLTALNETIEQKQKERKQELLEAFLFFSDQVEQGIKSIAEQGKRMGEITITTNSEMKTHEIEELLKSHYDPIHFLVSSNQTYRSQKDKTKSYFIAEVVIAEVAPYHTYGYSIIEGK